LAGALRVEPLTDRPDRLAVGAELYVEGESEPRRIARVESGGRGAVLHLAGIETREAAEALHERYLEADPLPLPAGTYYWHDLVGLTVRDPAGTTLGAVTDVFRTGENEVYVVTDADGSELLVPALRSVVQEIDLDGGTMVIDYRPEEAR